MPTRTAVIVGVGDYINRSVQVEDAVEPLNLMISAIHAATADTGLSGIAQAQLRSSIGSIEIVLNWTWPYENLPDIISGQIGCHPIFRSTTAHGGHQPVKILDEAARRISRGDVEVALITGGEALASLAVCANKGILHPQGWTKPETKVTGVFSPSTKDRGHTVGGVHSMGAPIHLYPLYEHGFRYARRQTPYENQVESARLYSDFSRIASAQPYAWNKASRTQDFIGTVSKMNRVICSPYPLFMNAFNNVNLAAACILTSTTRALELGIARDKWIYPLGGAGTADSYDFWRRPNYHSSPSLARSLSTALSLSNLTVDDISLFDLYSCFPIVPKLACEALGLPIVGGSKPLTLLGGLTFFGGAGNNYSMHALTEMTRQLRVSRTEVKIVKNGLVLGNGGWLTWEHAVVLSTKPRLNGTSYPNNPLPPTLEYEHPPPVLVKSPVGMAVIETYTVRFERDGRPGQGFIVGRMVGGDNDGRRFVANEADSLTLAELANLQVEGIGKTGWVEPDVEKENRNLFRLNSPKCEI